MANLETLFANQAISLERFSERQRELESQLASLRTTPPIPADPAALDVDPDDFLQRWPSFPFDQRLKIVQLLVSQVTVRRDAVEFFYRISDSLKDAPTSQHTSTPTHASKEGPAPSDQPIYIRLPKQGENCTISGLSRAKLNELILPNRGTTTTHK